VHFLATHYSLSGASGSLHHKEAKGGHSQTSSDHLSLSVEDQLEAGNASDIMGGISVSSINFTTISSDRLYHSLWEIGSAGRG
jgi:prephenate dehydratase